MAAIYDYISTIYEDFEQYVDKNINLCELMTVNYQAGRKPDYTDKHIQQLYLLRYAFSYLFEYKTMYESLFKREKFKDKIEVTSVGCGSMLDYWALVEALRKVRKSRCVIKYRGIDSVDWHYKIQERLQDKVYFRRTNAASFFRKTPKLTSNVYFFPKSISEFSDKDFEDICEGFRRKEIVKDRVHILVSLRADQGSMDRDMERSKKLKLALKKNGFTTNDKVKRYFYFKNEKLGIKAFDHDFDYPNESKELLASLSTQCNKYYDCADDCDRYLNRLPVLTARYIRFQIFTFDRKDLS